MAVSYPITLPTTPAPRSLTLVPRSAVSVTESPFTFSQQVYAWKGQQWTGRVEYPPMTAAQAEPLVSALNSLNGREGTFYMRLAAYKTLRGSGGGNPLVNGGSQTGYDLVTDGWPNSTNGVLKAGDFIKLDGGSVYRLHKVMADVNSNGSGQATLTLWPKLRESPSDNQGIYMGGSVYGTFRLTKEIEWSIDEAKLYGLGFDFVEAFAP